MKTELAQKLLGEVLNWDDNDWFIEKPFIQFMATYKYDGYQQYTQGKRFIESLAIWLNQFESQDRGDIYNFIKDNLVFISEEQMIHLVNIAFDVVVKKILIGKTKQFCNRNNIIDVESREKAYCYILRKTIFLGLSDGSHIDVFRRSNQYLSNEQIIVHYDFSESKILDVKNDLSKDLNAKYSEFEDNGFDTLVLLDDFSASGISFIRQEEDKWKGKIHKLLKRIFESKISGEELDVIVLLYVATDNAINYIKRQMEKYIKKILENDSGNEASDLPEKNEFFPKKIKIHVKCLQNVVGFDFSSNKKFLTIAEKYFNQKDMFKIIDTHFLKGKHSKPFLGFNECALPLSIFHNTPNNSVPIIWYDTNDFNGLFPRVSRHKEEK